MIVTNGRRSKTKKTSRTEEEENNGDRCVRRRGRWRRRRGGGVRKKRTRFFCLFCEERTRTGGNEKVKKEMEKNLINNHIYGKENQLLIDKNTPIRAKR